MEPSIYLCPTCNSEAGDQTICCDVCDQWFHYNCAGLSLEAFVGIGESPWSCEKCLSKDASAGQDLPVPQTPTASLDMDISQPLYSSSPLPGLDISLALSPSNFDLTLEIPLTPCAEIEPEPLAAADQEEVEYEVESIIGHKGRGKRREFEIKWKGYAETTWESEDNLKGSVFLLNRYCISKGIAKSYLPELFGAAST